MLAPKVCLESQNYKHVIDAFSQVYPECSSPDVALRRLLLENVLLLAGRRVPADTNLDVNNPEVKE